MTDEKATAPRFNCEQDDLLRRCSANKDMSQWNEWRKNHFNAIIELEGADFKSADLKKANLKYAYLKNAKFDYAAINEASFRNAELTDASFSDAKLNDVTFNYASLRNVSFTGADLSGRSQLERVDLSGANLFKANLSGAKLLGANLRKAKFIETNISSTNLQFVEVDAGTVFDHCIFDEKTDFTAVGLDAAGIEPELKAAFKDNIRRIHWHQWLSEERIKGKRLVPQMVECFWWITDYGSSTIRILKTFFTLVFMFAGLYWLIALPTLLFPQWQGIVKGLWQGVGWAGCIQTLIRSLYFSVVTMTTLGFGDMCAAESGFWASAAGDVLLSLQVLLGYLLLGALITRLGILFISEAPAAAPTVVKKKDGSKK